MSADIIQRTFQVPDANPTRLAGIENTISGEAFEGLPISERELWHSHKYEVTSGLLVEPGMPDNVDKEVMKILDNMHSKTFHTWPYRSKNGSISLSIPEIMALCHVGEPGGISIHVFTPGEGPDYPRADYDSTYSAQEATGCLTADYLREHAAGSQKNQASVTNISPDLGGHCMLYSTEECAGNSVMRLPNPRHLNLIYPE
ncbi:uncharacterized protein N0V89_002550 [Didymosphaeria variabile]|uniref:Uncharacterized protein n=1 Tax=Didymosphaeria variabile TaxID=1932322 RepID=A0A9W8XTQ7_9PLEO|nr:uncharacterized protein N0V89_002550 [Didymosphaeria variabile]KAJ4357973.1 hypothetical protein N0V89_002550 [Didymosphaeria variabile]